MRAFEYVCFEIASSSLQPLCCFAKTEIKSDLSCASYSYIKNDHYGIAIIIRFCHRLVIHDDKTVVCYVVPRHHTSRFSYNLTDKIYNVILTKKN